jgi:hypothetical protein
MNNWGCVNKLWTGGHRCTGVILLLPRRENNLALVAMFEYFLHVLTGIQILQESCTSKLPHRVLFHFPFLGSDWLFFMSPLIWFFHFDKSLYLSSPHFFPEVETVAASAVLYNPVIVWSMNMGPSLSSLSLSVSLFFSPMLFCYFMKAMLFRKGGVSVVKIEHCKN